MNLAASCTAIVRSSTRRRPLTKSRLIAEEHLWPSDRSWTSVLRNRREGRVFEAIIHMDVSEHGFPLDVAGQLRQLLT